MSIKVAIIVINWNNYQDTIECIESIEKINFQDYHIFLLDNNSTNQSVSFLKKRLHLKNNINITFLESNKNLGFAGGNNFLIKKIINQKKFKYILLLNNDCLVDQNFLNPLVNHLHCHQNIAVVSPTIINLQNKQKEYGCKVNSFSGCVHMSKKNENFDSLSGACLLIKISILNKVGLFNEKLFLYFEDYDLCQRIKQHGYELAVIPQSAVKHKVSQSTHIHGIKYFFLNRNRFWIQKKYLSKIHYLLFLLLQIVIFLPYHLLKCLLNFDIDSIKMLLKGYYDGINFSLNKDKIALIMTGNNLMKNAGGADRYFTSIFSKYSQNENNYDLYLICDQQFYYDYRQHFVFKHQEKIIFIPYIRYEKSNYLITLFNNLCFLIYFSFYQFKYRFKLFHVVSHSTAYILYEFLYSFFKLKYPKIVYSLLDCTLPQFFDNSKKRYILIYKFLFKTINISGVYTFYDNLISEAKKKKWISSKPYFYFAKHLFIDSLNIQKKKYNYVIWAARLIEQKNPMLFLEAIQLLKKKYTLIFSKWKFFLYGQGELKIKIKSFIKKNQLQDVITLSYSNNMSKIFEKSKIFISTQDFENFSSMSMLEAMNFGNALIALDVGQTNSLVKENYNGILVKNHSAEELAKAIYFLCKSKIIAQYGFNSKKIVKTQHNYQVFKSDIEFFWNKVINY